MYAWHWLKINTFFPLDFKLLFCLRLRFPTPPFPEKYTYRKKKDKIQPPNKITRYNRTVQGNSNSVKSKLILHTQQNEVDNEHCQQV